MQPQIYHSHRLDTDLHRFKNGGAINSAGLTGWFHSFHGVGLQHSARTGGATVKSAELIAISTFPSTADAQIAKGVLDEAGIESMIRADNVGGMYPGIAGAELLVRSEDIDKAHDALEPRQLIAETLPEGRAPRD